MDCYEVALRSIFNLVQHGRGCTLVNCPECRTLQEIRVSSANEYQQRVNEACKPYEKEPV